MSGIPPTRTRKIEVHTLSADFRQATRIVEVELPPLKADEVQPPFDAGFESIGVIEAIGSKVQAGGGLSVGQAIGVTGYGAFAERQVVRARTVIPLPSPRAVFLPLMVSALTASIALEQTGEMKRVGSSTGGDGSQTAKKETVLVTAAAGGTGLFAVQLAKAAGHTVIATCSSPEKVSLLLQLGVDRVIDYKKENLGQVLKQEYPKGIDIVYESVGGDMFQTCVANLAVKGRLIIIGFISGYSDGSGWKGSAAANVSKDNAVSPLQSRRPPPPLPALLLGKSASIRGFFLNDFATHFARHMRTLSQALEKGTLKSVVDHEVKGGGKRFRGLEQIADAIDHLYAGKNLGKVVVDLRNEADQKAEEEATAKQQAQQAKQSKL